MLTNARAAEILDMLTDFRRRWPESSSDPLVAEACALGARALRERDGDVFTQALLLKATRLIEEARTRDQTFGR